MRLSGLIRRSSPLTTTGQLHPEMWWMILRIQGETVEQTLPRQPQAGTILHVGRADTNGSGMLLVNAGEGDRFLSRDGMPALAFPVPMYQLTLRYVQVHGAADGTQGIWIEALADYRQKHDPETKENER